MSGHSIMLIVLALLFTVFEPARAQQLSLEDRLSELVGETYLFRPSVNHSDVIYRTIGDRILTASIRGRLHPLFQPEPFSITKVDSRMNDQDVKIELLSQRLGRAELRIRTALLNGPPVLMEDIAWFLDLLSSESDTSIYCSLEGGRSVHYVGCNHAPIDQVDRYFPALGDTATSGLSACRACFRPIRLIEDYDEELKLGRAVAGHVLSSSMAVQDDDLQQHVQSVGQDVLVHWPLVLRGYDYRFTVVDMDEPNAVACPGGWIFISRGLVDLCETDLELESVLAHEISHVEMRHGHLSLRKAQSDAAVGSVFAAILGAAAASAVDDNTASDIAIGMTALVINSAMNIAYAGYSKEQELESDAFSIAYIEHRYDPQHRRVIANVLQKIDYVLGMNPAEDQISPFDTHHSTTRRALFATGADVEVFSPGVPFEFTNQGEVALTVSVNCVTVHKFDRYALVDERYKDLSSEFGGTSDLAPDPVAMNIFTTIETTHQLYRERRIKDMRIRFGNRWVKVDNKEDPILYPAHRSGVAFRVYLDDADVDFTTLVPDSLLISLD